ncbi:ArsR family transcriptional regulator [Sphingomonas sp. RB3P16]|uniref:ArsR family transcriptional regulator n=1 Tax=Parasphingomonas frigoris TaxID=3096163 RepID=UPI002FC74D45
MKQFYEQDAETVPPRPGSRLVVRLVAEMQLAGGTDVIRALEDHLGTRVGIDRAMFLLVVLREGARFRGSSTGVASHLTACGEGISINAIAMSLGRPFETVRRHINALIGLGVCVRTPTGVIACPDMLERPRFATLLTLLHDRMVALIEQLADFDVALPATRVGQPYDPDATIAAATDLILSPFEYAGSRYRSWLGMVTVSAVVIASSRRITLDPVLARRYSDADTIPPEALRAAVTVSAIARAVRTSDSTVRREIERAIGLGYLKRVPGGVIASEAFLRSPTIARGGQLATERTSQVLQRLRPGGFRFDDPARCYLDGKPPLIAYS